MRAAAAFVLLAVLNPWQIFGQTADEAVWPAPVNTAETTQPAPPPAPAPQPIALPSERRARTVSWRTLPANLASDQKRIWTFPAKLTSARRLLPVLTLVGATAFLIESDPHTAPYFRNTTTFKGFNSVFTSKATDIGTLMVPVALYGVGLATKSSYARTTALLAGEAVLNSEIITILAKDLDRRRRPIEYPPHTNMSDSWFHDSGHWYRGHGSFPSGHTIAAFSVATVIARRYPQHKKWLPFVAYGLAGVVGFSRLTLSSHYPSDVLVGGVLGYSISRFAVLRQ